MSELMLRFNFIEVAAGQSETIRFLLSLQDALTGYIPELKQDLRAHVADPLISERLVLESQLLGCQAQLRWTKHALSAYSRKNPLSLKPAHESPLRRT